MKRFATIALALAALGCAFALGACRAGVDGGYSIGFGMVDVSGQTLTVRLENDHATDVAWEAEVEGEGVTLKDVAHEKSEDIFTFTGTAAGTQTITLVDDAGTDGEKKEVTITTSTDGSGAFTKTDATTSEGSSGSSGA